MNKEQLILLLKNYKSKTATKELKELELSCIIRKIVELQDKEPSTTSKMDGLPHGKGGTSDIVGNMVINRVDEIRELEKKSSELKKEIRDLDYETKQVDIRLKALKEKERELLTAYYVEGYTYEDIR